MKYVIELETPEPVDVSKLHEELQRAVSTAATFRSTSLLIGAEVVEVHHNN